MAGSGIFRRLVRIEPGISLGQWIYDRITGNWDRLVALFFGAGGMSILASATEWVQAYGPVGIGAIGLVSGLALWIGLALASKIRAGAMERRARAAAIEQWQERVDSFNPLDLEFNRKRIKITDLAHPITKKVERKRLIDCELIGPATIVFLGTAQNKTNINGVSFGGCDVVVARHDVYLRSVIVLEDVEMFGGAIWGCTIFIPPSLVPAFAEMGVPFSTLTGDPAIDGVLPQGVMAGSDRP